MIRLLDGWHELENRAWRWTERQFGAVIENVSGASRFELRFRKASDRALAMEVAVNGVALGAQQFGRPGDHVYAAAIPPAPNRIELRVRLTGDLDFDGRELGVVIKLPPTTIVDEECGIQLLGGAVNPIEL